MTMTVEEYSAGVDQLERKLARIAELRAAIQARRGEINANQASQFMFNDLAPKADVTGVASVATPTFDEGAPKPAQELGYAGTAQLADQDPATIGQDDSIEGIFAQVKQQLSRGQGGDAPAASTATGISDPLAQIEPPTAPQLNPAGDKPLMQSVDESLKAGGAALAESVTMGAITLSERDKKAIENSPIAGAIGSLIGDVPGVIGSLGAAKLTGLGFKQLLPTLIKSWNEGGELIGRTIVNAAAREGLGGAYWSTIKQAVEEIKNPEEQRTWNERLTRLATDVGMFAVPGAVVEGTMAGKAAKALTPAPLPEGEGNIIENVRPNEELRGGPSAEQAGPVSRPVDTQPVEAAAPREAPSAEQLAGLQDKFKPMDKVVEEGKHTPSQPPSSVEPPLSRGELAKTDEAGIEIAEAWKPKQYDYAAREVNGKPVYGEVLDVSEDGATVTFKPRKGKPETVKASELREPESIPRTPNDIDQVLEAAANKRRIAEEGRSTEVEPTKAGEGIPTKAGPDASPLRRQAAEEFKPVEEAIDDVNAIGGAEVGAPNVKGSFKRKVVDTATGLEAEAKARIKQRLDESAGGKLFDVVGATGEAAANLGDLAIVGAAKIAKGAVKFADWSEEMIREFGDAIKPHLDKIYKSATDNYHRNRAQATVDEHLAYMKDISQPFEYRPKTMVVESGAAPTFRIGYPRLKQITDELMSGKSKVTLPQLRKQLGESAWKDFIDEARASGAPLVKLPDGTVVPDIKPERVPDLMKRLTSKATQEKFSEDALRSLSEDAYMSGLPLFKTPEGDLIPVTGGGGERKLWSDLIAQAKKKYAMENRALTQPEREQVRQEARRLFLQEMVDRGVALKIKRSGVKLSPDVKRKTDLSLYIILREEIGAEKLKDALKGIPENDLGARNAMMQRLAMENGLLAPAVRAQGTYVPLEFATYGGFQDVSGEFLDPTRMIQQIDGALSAQSKAGMAGQAGPAERNLLWRTRDILIQKMRWQGDFEAVGKKVFGDLKDSELEQVTDILEELASKEATDLSVEGMLKHSEFRDITTDPRVLQAALDVRPIYDQVLDMQNALRVQRSQKPIPKRAFYSPHKQKEVSAWQELLGLNADPANMLSTGSMIPDFVIPNKPSIGHDLQRMLLDPKYALEKNAKTLLNKYLNAAARDIFDTSIIQNSKAFMDQLEVMGFGNSAVSLRNWVGQSFAGAPHAIDKGISEALKSSLGETVGKNWQKWSGQFRGALARSVFPLNFSWNLFLQTSSGVLTHTRYGTANSVKGAIKWFGDAKFREEVADNAYSFIVKNQKSGSISHQDFNQGMARAINLEKKPLEKAADYANFLSEQIEKHMTGWSVAAAYEDGVKKGLTGKSLWEYASDGGSKTQSMYNKEDLPGLLRSNGIKTIAPFQTFGFEMFNTIKEVMGKTGTPPANAQERVKTILRFVAGATAVNMISAEASGRKPWEIGSAIPFYPIFGAPIEAAAKGESMENASVRGLPSVVGIGVAFGKAVEDVMTGDLENYQTYDKLIQWAIRYGTAGAGIPGGTQLNRIYEGILADARGGQVDKNGKILFPITDTKEQIRAIFGGPYSTEAGQEKISKLEKGIEFSTGSAIVDKTIEALPVVGDVMQKKQPEPGIEIVPEVNPRPSSKRRSRPRSRR